MIVNKKQHSDLAARELRGRLAYNRITITALAKEMEKTRTTVNLWLIRGTTQERFDAMSAAIERILNKREV